ncbi:acyl-CoA desaturase [Frankia sp. AvcI1]|uniref:fatty acid desaturase family protein n=2 Tax=Frankia sp. AvcI1 TaxID=573496 RepID=UPI00211937DA|nr:acyl-CoA desaturase [Frankia sp. AvcI1]
MGADAVATSSAAAEPASAPVPTPSAAVRGSEYAELRRQVAAAALFDGRAGWYSARIAVSLGLLAAGWWAFVALGDSWWQLATAAFLAVMFTQVAFLGHDAGHRQICLGRRGNDALGLLAGNMLVGLSYGWWVAKHNRHHRHPNQVGRDPDLAPGAFVFTAAEAGRRRGWARRLTRHQASLFFPILLLEGLNLHVASVRELAERRDRTGRRDRTVAAEAGLLVVHLAGYLTAVALVLSPVRAVVFVLVHQGLFGLYMGCAFAPNHKGMTILAGDEPDFLRRQVVTARNIRGGRVTDVVFGGLNYQIEHHLFPSMPRPSLRRAQPLIRAFCQAHEVGYRETGALASYGEALRHLHRIGGPLRHPTPEKRLATASDLAAVAGAAVST